MFREKAFIYLATGLLFGLGMLIGRTQSSAIRSARGIVLALLYGLLPVLALIAVMFLASLPFTGLEPLWKTGHAGLILGWVIVLHVRLLNAVLQDGREQLPYPLPLRWLIQLSIALLPIYATLAVYGLGLRVEQYGWNAHARLGGHRTHCAHSLLARLQRLLSALTKVLDAPSAAHQYRRLAGRGRFDLHA